MEYIGFISLAIGISWITFEFLKNRSFQNESLIPLAIGLALVGWYYYDKHNDEVRLKRDILLAPKITYVIKKLDFDGDNQIIETNFDGVIVPKELIDNLSVGDSIKVLRVGNYSYFLSIKGEPSRVSVNDNIKWHFNKSWPIDL